jgi:hypothetical protein
MEQNPSRKATGSELVNKFPVFYETQRLIAAIIIALHLSLYCA